MKLRKLVSLFLALILMLGVCTVALAEQPWAGKKLGVAHITMYDEWCKAVYDEFMAQAPAMGFGEVNIQDGNLNAETQQKQVEDFITQGYDAILLDPVNSDGIVPTLQQAGAAGIPVFAFDSGTSYDKLVTHVAWDHAETGVLTAKTGAAADGTGGTTIFTVTLSPNTNPEAQDVHTVQFVRPLHEGPGNTIPAHKFPTTNTQG